MDYILVYNESKNTDDKKENAKSHVDASASRDLIAKKLAALGNETYIKYGLNIFKKYCFKNVYTFSSDEFNNYLINLHTTT